MKTLLVDCYLRGGESKMIYYRQICARYSEVVEVKLADWKRLFNCSNITAIVFSGSQWMISENDLNDELKSFVRQLKLPTLGICFGHQLLARSFGAKVKKGAEKIERAERIRILEEWEIFAGQGKETVMMASHQEYVSPKSIQAIGWQIGAVSDSCPVEAIRHPTLPLYGVQFHPERSGENGEKFFAGFYRLALVTRREKRL